MVEKRVKRLVVTDQDKIVGIVSQTDLVSHITDFQKLAKMGMT
jgi:CBS domain-containing protein